MILRDIESLDRENFLMFQLAYYYDINLNSLMTCRDIAKQDLFWAFFNSIAPALKFGTRKISQFNKTTDKLIQLYSGCISISDLPCEDAILSGYVKLYLRDHFTDGDGLFDVTHFKGIKNLATYDKNKTYICSDYDSIVKNMNNINYLTINRNEVYVKCSPLNYIIDHKYEDMPVNELRRKTIKDIIKMVDIDNEEEKCREKDGQCC